MLYGKNIRNNTEILQPISAEQLAQQIRQPDQQVTNLIDNMRIIRTVDQKRYAELKKQLPYVVCGTFLPATRLTENFANIETFIVDIDHLSEKQLNLQEVRQRIQADERVYLCFTSPSQDGIKILFQLTQPCYDHGLYTLFYKTFVQHFATQYGLQQVVDTRTSDVTRACFISHDPEAYYNPQPQTVNLNDYINPDSPQEMFDLQRQFQQQEKQQNQQTKDPQQQNTTDTHTPNDPDKEAMLHIKEILNLQKTKAEKQPVYVPEQLNNIINGLTEFLNSAGLQITQIKDIQYGKQITARLSQRQSQCNLFFGKKGFTVVQTTKTGTNTELNQLTQQLIQQYLDSY